MKKLSILMVLAALILCPAMNAQLLKNLGNRAINSAKNKVENKVTQKVDDAVDDAMDDVLNGKKNKTTCLTPGSGVSGAMPQYQITRGSSLRRVL